MDNHNSCTVKKCIVNVNTQSTQNNTDNNTKNAIYNICTANFCITCGENLGEYNPRQYCRKTYCPYENIDITE